MREQTLIIIGASLTGAKAAEELRTQGFDGRLLLIGSEPERPYERPPLTKDYLRGESEREKTYVHEQGFYEDHQIELETDSTVTGVDPGRSRIALADGRVYDYDRLLLATGAEPRRIPIAGAEFGGVHYLRTLRDCDALRTRLETGGRVVVVGARLDRQRVRGFGPPAWPRGHDRRSARAAQRAHLRRRDRRLLPRRAPQPRGRARPRGGRPGVRRRRSGGACANHPRPNDRVRLRRRRHRRGAACRASEPRRP